MKIAIGTDHRGYHHKEFIKEKMVADDTTLLDLGTYSDERSDYPIFAEKVAKEIQQGNAQLGILTCGTGIGMSIAANRFKGIYAGLVWNAEIARKAKEDDNVNVLVLPADSVSLEESVGIIDAWLAAQFKGGRYQNRITMIDQFGGLR